MSPLNGILVLNKPKGISSAGALTRIKHLFPKPQRPKMGHAGTLDPFATGVLLVLVGKATKRCQELMDQEKRYLATIRLGATTPTLDPTEDVTADLSFDPTQLGEADLQRTLEKFKGAILQVPPAFSAIKQHGQSVYHRARRGLQVELEPRRVNIYALELTHWAPPLLEIDVRCGRGTYIRSLARDIAADLGTTGYLTELCRTAVGAFSIENALDLDQLTAQSIESRLQ